ncbi:hypothetical protein B0H14DRAFT_3563568 [Mycena olivaceomarginata]|nr:hypothetical protein B0H14DRAFT_3563568 [Mycena olivaceomarginata]
MSTLQLIWDTKSPSSTHSNCGLGDNGNIHYTAQYVRLIRKGVYMFRIGNRYTEPSDVIALKTVRGKESARGNGSAKHLFTRISSKDLQGTVVPKCYGFYTAKVGRNTHRLPPARVLLLAHRWTSFAGRKSGAYKSMQAAYALHRAGVLHGDLVDGRHFVSMGHDIRIIDFAVAVPHKCVSGLSKRAAGHGRQHTCGCPELANPREHLCSSVEIRV